MPAFKWEVTMKSELQKGHLLTNLALACMSICLTLGAAELVLRSIVPLDPRNPGEFRIPDPVLGWVLVPDATYVYQMPEAAVTVTYNSQGWHDVEHEVNKPDGVFRILILGDSFMEADSVELEDAFHRHVAELTRSAGLNTEIINMGVAGYGTLQEYLMFEENGRLYAPDLVLLGFFGVNDLIDNSQELSLMLKPEGITTISRPYLDANETARWTIIPSDYETAQRLYTQQRAVIDAGRKKLTERILVFRLLRKNLSMLQNQEFLKAEDSAARLIERQRTELALWGVDYCVEPAEYTRAWEITERILTRLKEDVESLGSRLVVFSVPAREEVGLEYIKDLKADLAYFDRLCMEEAPEYTRLGRLLAKLDIEYINLLPGFREASREHGLQLYRIADLHWNPDGHALAADLVVSELTSRGILPISSQSSPHP